MRKSHLADHARMLRELAAPGTRLQQQQQQEREEEEEEGAWGSEGSLVPRGVVERALRDFEAHANRYDSYGDELGEELRRAGASPAAALGLASAAAAGGTEGKNSARRGDAA